MNNFIKILRIQSRIVIGGPSLHTILLSRYFNNEKFQTILIGGSSNINEKSMLESAQKNGIKCVIIPEMGRDIHFYDDLISLVKLIKIIKKEKPQIVHTHTAKAGAIGRISAFLAGVQYIFHTFHGHVFEGYFGTWKSKIFILFEKLLAKISTKIIVISEAQKKDIIIKYNICNENKIECIPLGFNWESFLRCKKDFSLRKFFNINKDKYLIGIIGRIVPIKDHLLFIDIAEKLINFQKNKYHFIIIGDGELKEYVKAQISQKRIDKYFTFTGWLELNKSVYRELDLLLLTSKNEGTPVAIIEALISGTHVIASNVGGVQDIMKHYDLANVVQSRNPDDYTKKILGLIQKKLTIPSHVSKNIKEFYSEERLIQNIENLYLNYISS